jgi:hypothetical protein
MDGGDVGGYIAHRLPDVPRAGGNGSYVTTQWRRLSGA